MNVIQLPISKSIANRLLILQAMRGLPLMDVSAADIPDDVRIIHDAVLAVNRSRKEKNVVLDLDNSGTALRFITAYASQLKGTNVVIDGCERLRHRPIRQLVQILISCGADIWYEKEIGFPPLRIRGRQLTPPIHDSNLSGSLFVRNPVSTQYVSALLLIGMTASTDIDSPYIRLTRSMLAGPLPAPADIEPDWSAAAFWYEYIAIHGGCLLLKGLREDSLQADRVVASLFRRFGVSTVFTPEGAVISRDAAPKRWLPMVVNFKPCPDLYPVVALTAKVLRIPLIAFGTDTLRYKESDRLQAIKVNCSLSHDSIAQSFGDHRVAMAMLAADFECDDIACINKSYPRFCEQLQQLKLNSL